MEQSCTNSKTVLYTGTLTFLMLLCLLVPSLVYGQIFQLNTTATLTGVFLSSIAWGDYDTDGDLDILLTGRSGSTAMSQIYRNDGGNFTDIHAGLSGVALSSAAWGDYDNDGDPDILLTGLDGIGSGEINRIYRNDGGSFTDIQAGLPGVQSGSIAWGDYDNDGDLDILLTGINNNICISRIYSNNKGSFTDIQAGLTEVSYSSVAWGDYDNDGDLDILLTGTDNNLQSLSLIYRNDGGNFTDIQAGLTGVSYSSVVWGDYDNDGDLDILLTGYAGGSAISRIYRNDGGNFTDIHAGLLGVGSSSVAWGDYDNDGDLDILLTGYTGSIAISYIYRSDAGVFTDLHAGLTGVANSSVVWGDYDNSGDLDILLTGSDNNHTHIAQLWRNYTTTANTISSPPTDLTVSGIGPTSATLSWNRGTDGQTYQAGLSYNVRIGTTSESSDVQSPMASLTGYRHIVALGGKQQTTSTMIRALTPGTTYYWSVQAIDAAFAGSAFATSGSFTTTQLTDVPGEQFITTYAPTESSIGLHADVYPNPAQESVIIRAYRIYDRKSLQQKQNTETLTLRILTFLGEEVDHYESVAGSTVRMATGSLASGVYFVRIESGRFRVRDGESGITSFVVQR